MENWWAICAWCKKKIRRLDEDRWRDIDSANLDQSSLENLSHGICPECEAKLRSSFSKGSDADIEPNNVVNQKQAL